MSESNSGVLSSANLSTIVAVTFIMALLSLALNFYTFSRLTEVATILGAVDVGLNDKNNTRLADLDKKVAELEAKIAAQKAAAPAAPAADGAAEGGK